MLGGLAIVHGDRRITRFQTQKTGALLAYLALHPGKSHSREAVAELLWPDGDPVAIRNRLNQAISSLRRQLHPPELGPGTVLVTDHHSIGVSGQTVVTDIEEFEKEIRNAESAESDTEKITWLERAAMRYKGELLEGYYEEWIYSKRMHFADLYDQALQQLIRSHVAQGTPDAAIEYARRRLDQDPYDETLHVILMRLYLRSGRPKSALKQFEDLVRALQQFDDEPSEYALKFKLKAEAVLADKSVDIEWDEEFDSVAARKSAEPAQTGRDETPVTLPRVVSSFVGRDKDLQSVIRHMVDRKSRLLTLLGLGGCGKTRLAIEAGWHLLETFENRVFFVPLANLEHVEDLPAELVRTLVPGQPNPVDPLESAVDRLSTMASCMLILDNFEHLAEHGAEFVSALLKRVPKLQILITSRIPLNMEGEVLISLAPLPLPTTASLDIRELAANPAVALFVERAQAVKADFQLTERTAETIVELSRKLEGLPLALELAASWARAMTPAQMLEQVSANVDRLASRRRDINPRHRSLRAAFDGSYDLLTDDLKDVFLRLTFFAGGWDYEASQHITPGFDAIDSIQSLEERSLIFSQPTDDSVRFSMLETVRTFGESLVTPDLYAECGWLHAEHFLNLVEQPLPSSQWTKRVLADYNNCLVALRWLKEQGFTNEFLRMATALAPYWEGHGNLDEGREWLRASLVGPVIDPVLHARAKTALGNLDWMAGDFDVAAKRIQEAVEVFQANGSIAEEIAANFVLQLEAHRQGNYQEAKRLLRTNQESAQSIGDLRAEARCWLALGNAELEEGEWDRARQAYQRSLEVSRKLGDPDRIGSALTNLANLALYEDKSDAAHKWIEEAVEHHRGSDHRWTMGMSLVVKGRVENRLHRYEDAVRTLVSAYRLAPDEKLVVWRFLLQFGIALHGLNLANDATRVFGLLEQFRAQIGERHHGLEMRGYDEVLAAVRQTLPQDRFAEQFEIGQRMAMEEVETIIAKVMRTM